MAFFPAFYCVDRTQIIHKSGFLAELQLTRAIDSNSVTSLDSGGLG